MKLTYHRCGDYLLPDLTIPDEPVTLGKYGRMRKTYLKEHIRKIIEPVLTEQQRFSLLLECQQNLPQLPSG